MVVDNSSGSFDCAPITFERRQPVVALRSQWQKTAGASRIVWHGHSPVFRHPLRGNKAPARVPVPQRPVIPGFQPAPQVRGSEWHRQGVWKKTGEATRARNPTGTN